MDPISFSEAISAVIAQRLVRKLCNKCKKTFKPNKKFFEKLKIIYDPDWFDRHEMDKIYKKASLKEKVGCKTCDQIGYRGRTAIFEVLECTPSIKQGIKDNSTSNEIREMALINGMRTLRMDAVEKVLQGVTDSDEVIRVC
jgi:type II secretory ATPase GspE/PulE/Tfp pilus assembly ATPase PilB-like protein